MTKLKKIISMLSVIVAFAVMVIGMVFFVRGQYDHGIKYQHSFDTSVGTPYESTNSTSRYVLTQAMVLHHSFALSEAQAKLASPDLVKYKNIYMSIFTPGVSFLGAPLYLLGDHVGLPQLFTYSLNLIFAVVNAILIYRLCRACGIEKWLGVLSAGIFMFATNGLVYALTFTQHQGSICILLLSILNSLQKRTSLRNIWLGALYALGVLFDIPNAFLLLPPLLYAISQHFSATVLAEKIQFKFKYIVILLGIGMIPCVALFGYYNYALTGSPTKLGQFIGRYDYPATTVQPVPEIIASSSGELKLLSVPFNTRVELEGLHILLLSRQRSWVYYSPILLLGFLGLIVLYQNKKYRHLAVICIAVVAIDVVLYSSFGDPWGGWAFGPRYLLPAAAVMSFALAVFLSWVKRQHIVLRVLAILVAAYLLFVSVQISVLGALTTAAIPPKGEAEALLNDTPWTTEYNLRILKKNTDSSLFYSYFLRDVETTTQYYQQLWYGLSGLLIIVLVLTVIRTSKIKHAPQVGGKK